MQCVSKDALILILSQEICFIYQHLIIVQVTCRHWHEVCDARNKKSSAWTKELLTAILHPPLPMH